MLSGFTKVLLIFVMGFTNLHYLPENEEQNYSIEVIVTADYQNLYLTSPKNEGEDKAVFYIDAEGVNLSCTAEDSIGDIWKAGTELQPEMIGKELLITLDTGTEKTSRNITIPKLNLNGSVPITSLRLTLKSGDDVLQFSALTVRGMDYFFLPSGSDLSKVSFVYSDITDLTVTDALNPDETLPITVEEEIDLNSVIRFTDGEAKYLCFSYTEGGSQKSYTVALMTSNHISSVYFRSEDPANKGRSYIESSSDHRAEASGTLAIYDNTLTKEYSGKVAQIKGRGNTTWLAEKKPYQIKLDKKADLLDPEKGKQKAKKWLLLSNPFDPTLLHNSIAFDLAYESGLIVTPEGRSIDFYYDGEYRGSYYLCEKNEIGESRVDIADLEDSIEEANEGIDLDELDEAELTNQYGHQVHYVSGVKDPEDISGGYLLELDQMFYEPEKSWFKCFNGYTFVSKEPEYLSKEAATYISEFVDPMIRCTNHFGINPDTGKHFFDYVDKDSFIRFFLVQQWVKNNDMFVSSTFFYKPAGEEILYAGPVWDCDASLGARIGTENPEEFILSGWVKGWLSVPEFREALKNYYLNEFSPLIHNTFYGNQNSKHLKSVPEYAEEIMDSGVMNFTLWKGKDEFELFRRRDYFWQNLNDLVSWSKERTEWMDNTISNEDFVRGYNVVRLGGKTRYETSLSIAETIRKKQGTEKLDTIIITDGRNYPDALCAGYLASERNGVILLTDNRHSKLINSYVNEHLKDDGNVIVLGGEKAVPSASLTGLKKEPKRLFGDTRYETNLAILNDLQKKPEELVICTGRGYADSLSASALSRPILLVDGKAELTDNQKTYLKNAGIHKFKIIGGTSAINENIEKQLNEYGETNRIGGIDRYETSVLISKEYFSGSKSRTALTASGMNFPDGLCGGPLANLCNAPLLLADTAQQKKAKEYINEYIQYRTVTYGYVLGGSDVLNDSAVRNIYGLNNQAAIDSYTYEE